MKKIQENNLNFILANQKISYVKILDKTGGTKLFSTDYNMKLTPEQVANEIKKFSNESGLKDFTVQLKSSYSNKQSIEYEVTMNGNQTANNNPMDINAEVERQVKNILERHQLEQEKREVAEEKARLRMWGEKLQHVATPLVNGIVQKYFAPLMMQGLEVPEESNENIDNTGLTQEQKNCAEAIDIFLKLFTSEEILKIAKMVQANKDLQNKIKLGISFS